MTYDGKNDQTITRNILGLPCLIEAGDGDMVEISYLSDGTKRYTIADNGEGPYYYGSFIYAYDEAAGETQLESIGHGEGRFSATSYTSLHEPVFSNLHYVTDRVGSVVAVVDLDSVANDGTDAVLEGNGYTPFGERFAIGGFPKMHLNRFRFNGKEHLNRLSLPYVDYDARYYDPTIARWHSPDPMADKYPDISPYAFCGNDPVNFVDPTGEDVWEIDCNGYVVNRTEDITKDAFYIVNKSNCENLDNVIYLEFEYDTVKQKKASYTDSNNSTIITLFEVNSEKNGATLFKFLADNTNVEQGLILTASGRSFVMNEHEKSAINITGLAAKYDRLGEGITAVIHSHPNNTIPSGYNDGDKSGDRFQVIHLKTSHGYPVDHYVYQPKYNGLIPFDEKRIIPGFIPWNALFY